MNDESDESTDEDVVAAGKRESEITRTIRGATETWKTKARKCKRTRFT